MGTGGGRAYLERDSTKEFLLGDRTVLYPNYGGVSHKYGESHRTVYNKKKKDPKQNKTKSLYE